MKRLAYFIGVYLVLVLPAMAQEEIEDLVNDTIPVVNKTLPRPLSFLELGVSANSYKGELNNYEKWTACYHAAIRFNQAQRLNGRLGFGFGFLTGENRFYSFTEGKPNNFFRTSVFFLQYEAQYNFIKTRSFMLYGSVGLGIYNYVPKNEMGDNLVDLLETRASDEVYGRTAFMLPIGIGAAYILKNGYGIGAQASFLNTQTDYLDNISLWGNKSGNDNVAAFKFFVFAPLKFSKPTILPTRSKQKKYYTRDF